jgi:hypothetical protein
VGIHGRIPIAFILEGRSCHLFSYKSQEISPSGTYSTYDIDKNAEGHQYGIIIAL